MPRKSFRSMSKRERRRNSLSARTFRSVVMSCILIGLVTLILGLGLYTYALVRQHITQAFNLSRQAKLSVTHSADAAGLCDRVMERYQSLTPAQRANTGSEEYRDLFADVEASSDYDLLIQILHGYLETDNVFDVYLAMYDEQSCAMVYVVDPEESARLYPGEWESVTEQGMRKFLDWDGEGELYDIDRTENYGWLCTSGAPIRDGQTGKIHGFVLVDIAIDNLIGAIRDFSLQLFVAILLVTALIAWILTRQMKRSIVRPINAIAAAAAEYTKDRGAGILDRDHFSSLSIHTGDEIENLSLAMADMERNMAEYVSRITAITAEKERIGTELALATKIQGAMLPNVFPPFPDRKEFDIYASMDPAKEVGGDFYDFFFVDPDHLCLLIADVSGKGIPAALFMMISKVILQSCAMLGQSSSEILSKANTAICSKNPMNMFVTAWVGILEISTGTLTAANAGHEYPAVLDPDGRFRLLKDKHGLAIGCMDGVPYREYTLQLEPGAKLFLYTDGVPEATDANLTLYGTDRMLDALNADPGANPKQLLQNVRRAVDGFVRDAEQFDDITMLAIEYRGAKTND